MSFAAFSTVLAVFENIMAMCMDLFGWNRAKTGLVNIVALFILSLPCSLGFNVLSFIQPKGEGSTFLDLEDYIVSNFLLPLGALVFVLFCTRKSGWGWENFKAEADEGDGPISHGSFRSLSFLSSLWESSELPISNLLLIRNLSETLGLVMT